ncbi:MAG: hypothetical protein GX463_00895 [Methanothrix sp.]|nr:hypothetical protein [Methanothrix sp.]
MPEKADFAIVFCRGYIDSEKIREALSRKTGILPENIWPLRKMGEGENEVLILLRNPYGGDGKAYLKEGTLENRFCQVISLALQYIRQRPEDLLYEGKEEGDGEKNGGSEQIRLTERSKEALNNFFFGPDGTREKPSNKSGFVFELKEARKRLRDGQKPFFINPMRIFLREASDKEEPKSSGQFMDQDEIVRVVDARINELISKGILKKP